MNDTKIPLVIIVGPTGVGKTELSIQLAEQLNAEIVSADSRLFYRGMDIGTAKPTFEQRLRVPHHLVDVVDPDQTWSLATFQAAAHQAIAEIHARQRIPILVGGTGQYFRAVVEGWQGPAVSPQPGLRQALQNWSLEITPSGLHERLKVIDAPAAELIDQRNVRRTIRALEVILSTGQRFSDQRQRGSSPFTSLTLGLICPRHELYQRIDARIEAMLAAGLVDEVRALISRGYTATLPSMSAIGYSEIGAYLQGQMSLEDAVSLMKRRTRIFVRRQANWFKEKDPDITWFEIHSQTIREMKTLINKWISAFQKLERKND
jgi:tRNA dimethylallyltransferase